GGSLSRFCHLSVQVFRRGNRDSQGFRKSLRCGQRRRLTQNQWRTMQESAPLTAISLPTLDRLSDRYQAASSCRVWYASPRTPSRPLHPEPAPRSHLRPSFRSAEYFVGEVFCVVS